VCWINRERFLEDPGNWNLNLNIHIVNYGKISFSVWINVVAKPIQYLQAYRS
jgi:hypothetical protein